MKVDFYFYVKIYFKLYDFLGQRDGCEMREVKEREKGGVRESGG